MALGRYSCVTSVCNSSRPATTGVMADFISFFFFKQKMLGKLYSTFLGSRVPDLMSSPNRKLERLDQCRDLEERVEWIVAQVTFQIRKPIYK